MLVNPLLAQDVVQDCVTDRGCSSTPDARDLISLTVAVPDKDGKTPLPHLSYLSVFFTAMASIRKICPTD